jgi:hypothetical protein
MRHGWLTRNKTWCRTQQRPDVVLQQHNSRHKNIVNTRHFRTGYCGFRSISPTRRSSRSSGDARRCRPTLGLRKHYSGVKASARRSECSSAPPFAAFDRRRRAIGNLPLRQLLRRNSRWVAYVYGRNAAARRHNEKHNPVSDSRLKPSLPGRVVMGGRCRICVIAMMGCDKRRPGTWFNPGSQSTEIIDCDSATVNRPLDGQAPRKAVISARRPQTSTTRTQIDRHIWVRAYELRDCRRWRMHALI